MENPFLEGSKMIFLGNALENSTLAVSLFETLEENGFDTYFPNINLEYEGKTININAFDQLKKRNPNNPYIIELKKLILKEVCDNIFLHSYFLLCNKVNQKISNQGLFELTIAWYLKKKLFSIETVEVFHEELASATGIISLHGKVENIYPYLKEEKDDGVKEIDIKHIGSKAIKFNLNQ
jgi:hypothetical protein